VIEMWREEREREREGEREREEAAVVSSHSPGGTEENQKHIG